MPSKNSYSDLLKKFKCTVIGDISSIKFKKISHIFNSDFDSLIFADKDYIKSQIFTKKIVANTIITNLTKLEAEDLFDCSVLVFTTKHRQLFSLFSEILLSEKLKQEKGIHPSSFVHTEAIIHHTVYIGPNTSIGKSTIGANTRIDGNCHIHDDVIIGKNCKIHAGAVVGVEGTGHVYDEEYGWIKFPQIGKTIIEDNVEIGANTYITKGALSNTVLKSGCVIGLDCGIGHNAMIEENVMILAKALIGGSSIIKQNTVVGIMATIRDGLTIGKGARIGMGAVVTKNVPEKETWMGNPARLYKKTL